MFTLSGKLVVTGEDGARIFLKHMPNEVFVNFIDTYQPIPCNPVYQDTFYWEIKRTHNSDNSLDKCISHCDWEEFRNGHEYDHQNFHFDHDKHNYHDYKYYLMVYWKVIGIREISWMGSF